MDIRQYMQQLFDRGDDPYGLTGKRDDTMEMLLAMMKQQNVPEEWGGEQQEPPIPAVGQGPRPGDGSWEEFQSMNPNLDYDAVARQSGGNVPGGNFSAAESTVTYEPTEADKALYKFVDQIPFMEAQRLLDSRSRAYDPNAAKLLLEGISAKQKLAMEQKLNDAITGVYGDGMEQQGGGRRLPPELAAAAAAAGVKLPYGAVDNVPSTTDLNNKVFKLRADALSFMEQLTDPTAMAMIEQRPELKSMFDYNKNVIAITQKYPNDPARAYSEIMSLSPLGQGTDQPLEQPPVDDRLTFTRGVGIR